MDPVQVYVGIDPGQQNAAYVAVGQSKDAYNGTVMQYGKLFERFDKLKDWRAQTKDALDRMLQGWIGMVSVPVVFAIEQQKIGIHRDMQNYISGYLTALGYKVVNVCPITMRKELRLPCTGNWTRNKKAAVEFTRYHLKVHNRLDSVFAREVCDETKKNKVDDYCDAYCYALFLSRYYDLGKR